MSNLPQVTNKDMEAVKLKMTSLISKEKLDREISFAMQAINSSEKLRECSKESLQKAVYNIALTGLSLNPVLKFAYLIPRWSKLGTVAVLEPSYQGLIKLLSDTDVIDSISAFIVYEGDEFEIEYGSSPSIKHKPKFKSKNIELVYAIASLNGTGEKQFEVMSYEEVCAIRDKSESYKAFSSGKISSCIWSEFEGEMFKKTVIKRLFKYLPKSEKFDTVATAIAIADEDYTPSDNQMDYLVTLIERAGYDDDTKRILVAKVYEGITKAEFETMRKEAEMNQMDAISSGRNYGQSDISEHLNKMAQPE